MYTLYSSAWSDAGPVGVVSSLQCREPIKGQHMVQLYYEDDPLCSSCFLRTSEALCQMKKQQFNVKFWIWGLITV